MGRSTSDEHYVLDLCDEILGAPASRQHRFEWLRGDTSPGTGRSVTLPVDGYWESHRLVVEFAERQHSEAVPFFDRRQTLSGVGRGEQRRLYDDRRVELIPRHGLRLVVIPLSAFKSTGGKIVRDRERDISVIRGFLEPPVTAPVARADTYSALRSFVAERDWSQFHTPENLAKSVSIEAAELLECFQWSSDADPQRVAAELADVLTYCFLLADKLGVDPDAIVLDKLRETREKYPVEKARGRSTKYDQL